MASEREDDELTGAKPIAGAPFGWECDLDLTAPLSEAQRAALLRIYRRDGLILFRGQALSREQQQAACDLFGPALRTELDNYVVSNVVEGGFLGKAELLFHNDIPYVPAPFLGGSLHALEVAEGAAATRFANALRAWDRLPSALKTKVEGLNALHVRGHMLGRRTTLADLDPGDMATVHPVVGKQEGTCRPYLFVNLDMSACITKMAPGESDALLEDLFGYLYAPDNVYEHHWREGDLVIWDNLAVQHARSATGNAARTLQRVTIAHFGYWEQVPTDLYLHDALQKVEEPAS
ncbi:TauD/TfdA family dioxygenase [Novosphingobium sp. G106]|uniref:TauD/TfdA dioxygenase family protein n=1 Tax=Novosphingobium sp. G106 TaxID=2849500 RepID=UPI001C2CD491|nr:TauD/TfdA family dioxygenase [Novosphingobium sp. G106]MBV1686882.1 TauD/TfdA family dioxygenase [Novosphingobium sp. G106]